MAYTWAESSGRYRDARGRYASDRSVRAVIDSVADGASDRLGRLAQELLDGTRSLGSFQAEAMREIRLSQVSVHVIARGGAAQMRPADYLAAARDIKEQYRFMRGMADDIASGRQPMNGRLVARARMYGQASRVSYEKVRNESAAARGMNEARNTLHARESCSECRALARRGWMPAEQMTPVGARKCLSQCRCVVERRRQPVGVAA